MSASWDARQQSEEDVEQDVVVQMHTAGDICRAKGIPSGPGVASRNFQSLSHCN